MGRSPRMGLAGLEIALDELASERGGDVKAEHMTVRLCRPDAHCPTGPSSECVTLWGQADWSVKQVRGRLIGV